MAAIDELDALRAGDSGEALVDTGLDYGDGESVLVSVRKRGRRYDIDDRGRAAAKAGKPRGWLDLASEVVARDHLNINRAGVIFVPAVEGGLDVGALALRVGDRSLALYEELLDLVE